MANKTLFIVESPAKARKISKFLGKDYIVEASAGHIVDLTMEGKDNLGVDIENGFTPKYGVIPSKKSVIKILIKRAKEVDKILLATDDDREGEAIAWHLYDVLKKTKKPFKRVTFHEITKEALLKSLKNQRDLDKNMYDSQQARRVLDRIVGFSVSPFLIRKYGPKLSAGRVQSVAVRLVVDREREIEAFVPEEYWTITASLAKSGTKDGFVAKYTKRVTDGKTAAKVKKDLDGDTYIIKDVVQVEQKQNAPPPLITSSMQSAAAGKYKFSASKTMKAAQALYEAGMITYLRTDSVRCDDAAIQFCRKWLGENGYDKPKKPNKYTVKKAAQAAHEAIRPTNVENTPKNVYLSDDQQKLYTLIWERFVASQMNPALYDATGVIVKTSSNHELKANGRVLKYKGWLEIMDDLDSKKDKNVILPPLSEGDKCDLIPPKVKSVKKATKPPPRFTERKLIDELEKRGIGRPSTYAAIMSKITDRSYVKKKSNAFIPTESGKKVVDSLVEFFDFMEIKYTADMESKLDEIADGTVSYLDMMSGFYNPFKGQLKKAYMSANTDYGFRCKKCGKDTPMYLKHGKFGYFLACMNYRNGCTHTLSCDMVDEKPVLRKTQGDVDEDIRCPVCKSGMVKRDGQFGPFYSCSEYPICKGTRKVPYGKKCPECKNELYATIFHGDSVLFCMGYSRGCRYSEPLKDKLADPKRLVDKKPIPKRIKKMLK